jgi:hypothetical protein
MPCTASNASGVCGGGPRQLVRLVPIRQLEFSRNRRLEPCEAIKAACLQLSPEQVQGDPSGARLVQARKRRIVDRDAGEQVGDLRRVGRINFTLLSRQRIALDLETFKVSAPLLQVHRWLCLLQARQQRDGPP